MENVMKPYTSPTMAYPAMENANMYHQPYANMPYQAAVNAYQPAVHHAWAAPASYDSVLVLFILLVIILRSFF